MIEVKAPNNYNKNKYTIFLAGAIDQGEAVNWQQHIVQALNEYDVLVLNPRRDQWNNKCEQKASNLEFAEQVSWELQGQDVSDLNIFVFTKDSKAPITFMELGLFGRIKPAIICVEEGFYRTGNLDVVAKRYRIPICYSLEKLTDSLHKLLDKMNLKIA